MATSYPWSENRVNVVAAVIERDGRFLLCRRNPLKRHGGLWEFPGGKLEIGETHSEAAKRELKEELGVTLSDFGGIVFSLPDPNSNFIIDFARVTIQGEPSALEHMEIRWAAPSELGLLEMAPCDLAFARELMNREL